MKGIYMLKYLDKSNFICFIFRNRNTDGHGWQTKIKKDLVKAIFRQKEMSDVFCFSALSESDIKACIDHPEIFFDIYLDEYCSYLGCIFYERFNYKIRSYSDDYKDEIRRQTYPKNKDGKVTWKHGNISITTFDYGISLGEFVKMLSSGRISFGKLPLFDKNVIRIVKDFLYC